MNYFVTPDIWVERKKKSVIYFKETTRVEWFAANWALKIIIFRYFAFFLELINLLFFTVFSFYICFVHDFFRVRTCVPCVQVATPLKWQCTLIDWRHRPFIVTPSRNFCGKQFLLHSAVCRIVISSIFSTNVCEFTWILRILVPGGGGGGRRGTPVKCQMKIQHSNIESSNIGI